MNRAHFLQVLCIFISCSLYGIKNPEILNNQESSHITIGAPIVTTKIDPQLDEQPLKITPIPEEHKELVGEMKQILSGPTEQAKQELVDANILPDAQKPDNFQATSKINLERVKFETNRLTIAAKKWGQIRLDLKPEALVKGQEWADNCRVRLYVGFKLSSGKMLLLRAECTFICLKNGKSFSAFFYIPGDVRDRYKLPKLPDYCAIRISVDGHDQEIIIVDKNGKNSHVANAEKVHKDTKEKAQIEIGWMRNIDQMPANADVRKEFQPATKLEI